MPGRGDNNKHGSAGRGASNQSNQAFIANGENQPKSNHGDQTGGKPSRPKPKKEEASSNRDHAQKK